MKAHDLGIYSGALAIACYWLSAVAWAAPPPPQTAASASNHAHTLAPVGVTGAAALKGTVRALQEIKVALKRPISGDPANADLTVCQLAQPSRGVHVWERMDLVLTCGSNSWWLYRRDNCQSESIADCAAGIPGAAFKRQGMWHNMWILNSQQVVQFRQLIHTLPPPGSTRTIVITGYHATPIAAPSATSKP